MVKGFMAALVEQKPKDVPAFARDFFGDTELARRCACLPEVAVRVHLTLTPNTNPHLSPSPSPLTAHRSPLTFHPHPHPHQPGLRRMDAAGHAGEREGRRACVGLGLALTEPYP